ncbi:NADPH oxidase activator 1 isoform X2 [Dendrobates tinctorius]|uniref:NADPH oxidase activator 1 isoform X2 n=1 Tax=Dendrobates tinctorius TaxID=92724 RepID=UPI003CC9ACF1
MPYKDLIKCWHQGVLATEKKDWDSALKSFTSIEDPPSKIWFNIGYIHVLSEDFLSALQAYSQCVTKDPCLAVGFFQRSYVHFKLKWYEKALADCHLAMAQLRNNSVIDYKQLGLNHLLYTWEVLYNTAVILCYLGKWESAQQKINEAVIWLPGDIRNAKLDAAQDQIRSQQLLQPIPMPDGKFFRPRKQQVERLNSIDFLGKPKVISSVVPNDQYSGFEPLRPQKPGYYLPCPRGDAGYHRVMVHYYPENTGEVAVKANNIVYVLHKHGDWATVIHDGQKILIPKNILELVDAPKADMKKINNGIPLPPMKMPPTRPNAKTVGNMLSSQHLPLLQMTDPSVPNQNPKREDPYSEEEQVLTTMVQEEDEMKSVPSLENQIVEASVHPGPVEMTAPTGITEAAPYRPLQRVEMVVTLQSCAPVTQEVEKEITEIDKGNMEDEMSAPLEKDVITILVHTEFTVDLSVSKNITYQELQRLLRDKLQQQGEKMKIELSYRDSESKRLTLVKDDGDLPGMWTQADNKRLMLCCKDSCCVGRPILFRMKAIYTYTAEGPEDLPFKQGDFIDIFSEVNEEWLEGHCNGSIGIFPRCFATKVSEQDTS